MYRSKIVFILGAGSSEEVGLPIGEGLKQSLAGALDIRFNEFGSSQISGDFDIMGALWEHSKLPTGHRGDPNPYLYKIWRIRDALPLAISIDNLLDAYRDDKQIQLCGKLGIARCILDAEKNSRIFTSNGVDKEEMNFSLLSNTWFSGFVKVLTESVSLSELDSIFKNVTFLNFNYDRCIMHYLYHSLQSYYGIDEKRAASCLKNLSIHHPYGSVGELPWATPKSAPVPFGGYSRLDLLSTAKQIKTFNERVDEVSEIEKIRLAVQEADIIVFLGFAYHRQNLELLKPNISCKAKRVYGTAYGISHNDCEVIASEIRDLLGQDAGQKAKIDINRHLKCNDLFREYWRSLSA